MLNGIINRLDFLRDYEITVIIFVAVTQLNSLFKNEAGFLIWASKNFCQKLLKA